MPSTTTTDKPDGLRRRGRFIDGATFGAFLQNHREGRNLSLHDIAADTKIATRHLAALEGGDVRSWPGGLYRRAMVRAYATAVGLDPDVTVSEFTEAFAELPVAVEPEPIQASPAALHELLAIRPRAPIYLGLAVCATIAVLGWATTSSDAAGAMKPHPEEPAHAAIDGSASRNPSYERNGSASRNPSYERNGSGLRNPSYERSGSALRNLSYDRGGSALRNLSYEGDASAARNSSYDLAVQQASDVEPAEHVEGSLRIVSEPAGADVTVNGIRWGHTPVTVRYLPPGEKRVRVSMQGYASAERRLELTADRPVQAVRLVLSATP